MTSKKEHLREAASEVQASVSRKLRRVWWAFLLRGLLALGLAICALAWPQQTIGILTKLLGAYFIIDGVAGFVGALRSGDRGSQFLPAVVSFAAGLALLFWSEISAKIFLVIVGIWAAFQGIGMLVSGWQMDRGDEDRTLVGIVGLIVTVVGVIFIAWPEVGVVAISWLIAIGAGLVGVLLIYLAIRLKKIRHRVDDIGKHPG